MPRRTPPVYDRVKNRYSEKSLRVPSDFAILASTLLAIVSAGIVVLVIVVIAALIGLIIFNASE